MDDTPASPSARATSIKRTYGSKKKRVGKTSEHSKDSGSDSEDVNNGGKVDDESPLAHRVNKSKSVMKASLSKVAPRKVDAHLPGPSSGNKPHSQRQSTPVTHSAGRPSGSSSVDTRVLSFREQPKPASRSFKPPSAVSNVTEKPSAKLLLAASDEELDDTVSIAESKASTRTRRTEAERMNILKADPSCGAMESHRVECLRCQKWINLSKRQTYALRPWEQHRVRCDQKAAQPNPKEGNEESDEGDDAASVVTASAVASERPIRRSESERRAALEADPYVFEVQPHAVHCKNCQKWIKLSKTSAYNLSKWDNHKNRCTGSLPSSRVATFQRKLQLLNDPDAKQFTGVSVDCAVCDLTILLEGKGDYNLTQWVQHKSHCKGNGSMSMTSPMGHSLIQAPPLDFPSVSPNKSTDSPERASASIPLRTVPTDASTDSTLVAANPSPDTRIGEKRLREDDHMDGPPANRPKTDSHVPSNKETANAWDMLFAPFKSFVRGFREGFQLTSELAS